MTITILKILVCYLVLILIYALSAYIAFTYTEKTPIKLIHKTTQYIEKVIEEGPIGIFRNNIAQATRMFMPIIGPLYAFIIMMNTGQILGVYVESKYGTGPQGLVTLIFALLVTILYPYAIIEILAYAIALEASLTFTIKIFKHCVIDRRDILSTLLKYCISAILLIVAAYMEYLIISQAITIIHSSIGSM